MMNAKLMGVAAVTMALGCGLAGLLRAQVEEVKPALKVEPRDFIRLGDVVVSRDHVVYAKFETREADIPRVPDSPPVMVLTATIHLSTGRALKVSGREAEALAGELGYDLLHGPGDDAPVAPRIPGI